MLITNTYLCYILILFTVLDHPPRPVSSQLASKSQPQVSGGPVVKSQIPHPAPVPHGASKDKPSG